jgi:DNA end-binding protein Ku
MGKIGQGAFAVIRDTIGKMKMMAFSRIVFTRREHVIALEPKGTALSGWALPGRPLRYPYEV